MRSRFAERGVRCTGERGSNADAYEIIESDEREDALRRKCVKKKTISLFQLNSTEFDMIN